MKILSEEHKRKISEALKGKIPKNINQLKLSNKGKHLSEETKLKISLASLGRKLSEQTKQKMSLSRKGRKNSEYHNQKVRLANLGLKHTKERVDKMIKSLTGKYTGSKASNWKGGSTDLNRLIRGRSEYRQWVSECMTRDNWTCRTCNKIGGKLQVHHKESFAALLKLYNINTVNQALNCKLLWNVDNGITLCEECHKETDTYLKNKTNNQPLFNFIFNNQSNVRREKSN